MRSFDLPEEIVLEILLYLPVISLLRFKSVCNSWRSLIESTDFITQHFYKSNDSLIIKTYPTRLRSPELFTLLSGNKFDFSQHFRLPHEFHKRYSDLQFVGCCHGIICIHDFVSGDVFLWNPATKRAAILPDPIQDDTCIGFGVDYKTNEYKVLRFIISDVFDYGYRYGNHDVEDRRVEVYNLGTDSWRMVDTDFCVYSIICRAYGNGIYVWLGTDEEGSASIYSFDFGDEVIGTMSLPDTNGVNYPYLGFIGESIACISHLSGIEVVCHVEIWVLKEYGVKESWSKLYTLGPFSTWPIPKGVLSDGEFILFQIGSQLLLCDLVSQEMRNLFQVQPEWSLGVVLYKESLA